MNRTWFVVIAIVIITAIAVGSYLLMAQESIGKIASLIPLNKPVPIGKMFGALGVVASNTSTNFTYKGYFKMSLYHLGAVTAINFPLSMHLLKNGTAYKDDISFGAPNGNTSQASYINLTLVKNTTQFYICVAPLTLPNGGHGYSCMTSDAFGIFVNATFGGALNATGLLNGLNFTLESVSPSSYKGNGCELVKARVTGYLAGLGSLINQSINLLSRYGGYYSSIGVNPYVNGTITSCLRANGMPLMVDANLIFGYPKSTSLLAINETLNETFVGGEQQQSAVYKLPGPLLSLSQLLPGYCYAYQIGGAKVSCGNLQMNASHALRFNYSYSSRQQSGFLQLLGIACSPARFNYQNAYDLLGTYTPVNITMPNTGNVTLYTQCEQNSTVLGKSFSGSIWSYYKLNGVVTGSKISDMAAYTTTNANLGINSNTGPVSPLASVLPPGTVPAGVRTFMTNTELLVQASDPQDSSSRTWSAYIDRFPGAYVGNGIYTNRSNYSIAASSGGTLAYFTNITGRHTIYVTISQDGGSAYGTYNVTTLVYSITYSGGAWNYFSPGLTERLKGIDAHHVVKLTVTPGDVLANATVVSA